MYNTFKFHEQSALLHGLKLCRYLTNKIRTVSSNSNLFSGIRLEHDFDIYHIRGQNSVDWNMILTSIWGQNSVDNQFNEYDTFSHRSG